MVGNRVAGRGGGGNRVGRSLGEGEGYLGMIYAEVLHVKRSSLKCIMFQLYMMGACE